MNSVLGVSTGPPQVPLVNLHKTSVGMNIVNGMLGGQLTTASDSIITPSTARPEFFQTWPGNGISSWASSFPYSLQSPSSMTQRYALNVGNINCNNNNNATQTADASNILLARNIIPLVSLVMRNVKNETATTVHNHTDDRDKYRQEQQHET